MRETTAASLVDQEQRGVGAADIEKQMTLFQKILQAKPVFLVTL